MTEHLSRRRFLKLTALAAVARPHAAAATTRRPNIVMYLSDDHGYEFTGCYGDGVVHTPNIDALATEGMRFTKMFAASPTCVPSRSVLYTGLYPYRNGAMGNHTKTRQRIQSLPTYLRALGYRVVLANKVHVQPPNVFDFEILEAALPPDPANPRTHRDEGLDTQKVDAFLASHAAERGNEPLCLILADDSPHVTWEKNRDYDPAMLRVPPYMVDTPMTRRALANYYQDVTTMDGRVGEVMASLRKHGFEDTTLFIYTTDQGSEWPHSKWTVYDTGIRVPFIARWPGRIEAGSICDALVSFVDMTGTFVDVAGGDAVEHLDGRSFLDVLLGNRKDFRDYVFASHTRDGDMNVFPQRGLRDSRYKYVLNLMPENKWTTHFTKVEGLSESHATVYNTWLEKARMDPVAARLVQTIERHGPEEVYDTQEDPYELNNIIDRSDTRPILKRMRAQLKRMLHEMGDPAHESVPENPG